MQTNHLLQARSKFEGPKNTEFDYSMFHECVVRLFFDILHGIERKDIPLAIALEFAIFLGFDGQLKQNSDMEKELFESAMDQFCKTKMTKTENALVYLYAQTWGLHGEHLLNQRIWNFQTEDLQMAIMTTAYRGKNEKTELIEVLRNLILGRFDNGSTGFYEWSQKFHSEVSLYDNLSSIRYQIKILKGFRIYRRYKRSRRISRRTRDQAQN